MKILLLSKDAVFLADTAQKKFQTQYGEINLEKVRIGKKIKSTKGKEFIVAAPTLIDLLKKAKRGPQIITPKDAGAIAAITGVTNGWRCLDAGSGSGFLALFLGNLVRPNGNVYTYEKKKENYEIVKKNIVHCGLEETVTVKNADALKGFKEKNLDLITLDMQFAEKLAKRAYNALKPGGWLCVYSPHIEQQIKAVKAMEKEGFVHMKTVETIQREWKISHGFSHPRHSQVVHTGFITTGRKI